MRAESPLLPASAERLMELVCVPIDRVRHRAIALLGDFGRTMVRDRELRVAMAAVMLIGIALAFTIVAPFYLLVIGPVLLGVPHLIGDLRYLIVRPGLHRRVLPWLAIGVPCGFAIAGHGSVAGAAALVACALVARGPLTRRAIVLAAAGAFAWCAIQHRAVTDLVVAHAHNGLAIVIWAMWRERKTRMHVAPIVLFVVALVVLFSGALDPVLASCGALTRAPEGASLESTVAWYAPGIEGAWALRLTLAFVFAQSVHYAVWTRFIAEDDRERATPRTFAASVRALRKDFGLLIFLAVAAVAIGITVWATWDLDGARRGYLRISHGHAFLELSAAAFLWMERGRYLGMMPAHETQSTRRPRFNLRTLFSFSRV